MKLFFGGCEQQGFTRLLTENGVTDLAISFWGLKRRQVRIMNYSLAEKYPENASIFLDSGGHTANTNEDLTPGELQSYFHLYLDYVEKNIDRLAFFSEFDALALGPDWIKAQRENYPGHKLMVVWHPHEDLRELAKTYKRIGITQTSLKGSNLTVTLNNLVREFGTELHGIGMTKPDEMRNIKFHSVASTSWLSPSQYGDTIVWSGNELKRYPKKYKDRRKMHVNDIRLAGCDPELIEADDSTELLKLSIWSWKELMKKINSNSTHHYAPEPNEASEQKGVVIPSENMGNEVATREPIKRDRINLPILDMEQTEETFYENGQPKTRKVPLVRHSGVTVLQCSTCFLAEKCPAYSPGYECAFNIPVEIRTKEQRLAAQDALIQFQYSRVAVHYFGEQVQGGQLDKNLSDEMKNLERMLKTRAEMENDGFSVSLNVKGSQSSGIMSHYFGSQVGEEQITLPKPLKIEDIADAEIIGE